MSRIAKTLVQEDSFNKGEPVIVVNVERTKKAIRDLIEHEILTLETIIDPKYHGVFVAKVKELDEL